MICWLRFRADTTLPFLPIIAHTDQDLTKQETLQLQQYAESTVIKSTKSSRRIFNEIMLFLRQVESRFPAEQPEELHMVDDEEVILHDKTVLIVDDDMRNAFALSVVLEEKGSQTRIAENGEGRSRIDRTLPRILTWCSWIL